MHVHAPVINITSRQFWEILTGCTVQQMFTVMPIFIIAYLRKSTEKQFPRVAVRSGVLFHNSQWTNQKVLCLCSTGVKRYIKINPLSRCNRNRRASGILLYYVLSSSKANKVLYHSGNLFLNNRDWKYFASYLDITDYSGWPRHEWAHHVALSNNDPVSQRLISC